MDFVNTEFDSPTENEVIADVELPLEEDIVAELEEFIFLGRLGVVDEALEILEMTLWPYLDHFPVAAEAAAFLVENGIWERLPKLLDALKWEAIISGSTTLEREELRLLGTLFTLGEKWRKHPFNRLTRTSTHVEHPFESMGLSSTSINYGSPAEVSFEEDSTSFTQLT